MCTIHVFTGDFATKKRHTKQIITDYLGNYDGSSAILLDENNDVFLRVQCTQLCDLMAIIRATKARTYIVHLRASTSSTEGIPGCHMFDTTSGDWTYCHNGVISQGRGLRVDSLILDDSLDSVYPDELETLPYGFANVVAYHHATRMIVIHRSTGGRLTTDSNGNWSTNAITADYKDFETVGWCALDGAPMSFDDNTYDIKYKSFDKFEF